MIDQECSSATILEQITEIPKQSVIYLACKRCFDFIVSLCASILLVIPLLILALIIMIKDPGNPFYVQKRVGQDGKVLKIAKLRSMKKGADHLEEMLTSEQLEQYLKDYKLEDDPRLIGYGKDGDGSKGRCFGAFLRRASLDELPQIVWNIFIKGDMSVVGPRPILPDELTENYTPEEQKLFLSVKPGLTGYWQAYARNNVGYEEHRRQDMELYYIKNARFLLDIRIILKTVGTVIHKTGAK